MATIPNKIYKLREQSGAISYQVLPGTNVPYGMTEVKDPNEVYNYIKELKGMGVYVPGSRQGVQFDAAGLAKSTEETMARYQTNPDSGLVASYQTPWGETLTNVPQSQINEIETQQKQAQAGKLTNFQIQAGKPPLYVPSGTPTPQQSNAAFQASQPKPTYQEFKQGHQAVTNAGVQAPSNYEGANAMFNQFLPPQQAPSAVDNFVAQDPYLNSVMTGFQQQMSQLNQRTSLVQEYQNLLKTSGIEAIDMNLINMKNVIEGTEDDIRTEVTKAGGFATDSQVIALSNVRNKQLIKNYNTLLETRNFKERYLDTVMNLTQQDRQEADRIFETKMNFGFKIAEINQTMKKNAVDTLDRVAKTLGWDGVLNATQGSTQLIAQIERTYGLPQGGLQIAAQQATQARQQAQQETQLGLQEKKLGIELKQQQIEGMPLERQLKAEQIKTEQAQRAKIYSDIQKVINEQKGSILDPKTPQGAKQLATMKGQVDQIQSILTSSSLNNAVGTNILSRTPEKKKGILGGAWDFVTGGWVRRTVNPGLSNFIGDVEQLRSQLNLQALIDAKSKGATFGALSDQELQVLSNSATKIGVWAIKDANGNVAGYNAKESDFKKEVDKINNFAKLDYIYRGGNPADVEVQVINGKYYTKNSDGSVTEL